MDWTQLIENNLGAILSFIGALLLGVGGIIGYLIRSRIDTLEKDKERRKLYRFERTREQHDLLVEFLGVPKSNFHSLYNIGDTWDQSWRRDKANTISEWADNYHPLFPEEIQPSLNWIRNIANIMVADKGLKFSQRPEGIEKALEHWDKIKAYKDKLEQELKGG